MSGKQDSAKSDTGMNVRRTASTESTASISTVTTGRFTTPRGADSGQEITFITSFGQNLYHTVSAIIWCPKHKKMCLSPLSDQKGLFLPSMPVKHGIGWFESAHNCAKETLTTESRQSGRKPYLSFSAPKLIHVLELQIPVYLEFISRRTFYCELTHDPKYATDCCQDSSKTKWFKADDLRSVKELWGPEPMVFAEAVATNRLGNVDSYTEYTVRDVLKFAPRDPPKSFQEELVKSGGFGAESDIFRLFGDYTQHSFPAQYMTAFAFEDYMTKVGLPEQSQGSNTDFKGLFRAFSFNSQPYISFTELLLGFCALEKSTPHGGHTGELRSSYIFRYYNSTGDKGMNSANVKSLAQDIIKMRGDDQKDIDAELKQIYNGVLNSSDTNKNIDLKSFVKAIGERRLRGTAPLFRSQSSPIQVIRTKRVYESIAKTQIQAANESAKMKGVHGTCMRCKLKKYTLAKHTVRLSKDGVIIDPQENKGQSDIERMDKPLRRMSDKCFLRSTFSNQLLDHLREFALSAIPGLKGSSFTDKNSANHWANKNSRNKLAEKIFKDLLPNCEKIFKNEPRLIHVSSPTFVLGDLHGNLHDLMIYENSLWKMGPTCVAANFLFLGDYVDRGEYSVEVILYLLCHKVLCPDKYWLLRGNHELRNVQLGFTFKNECLEKFGTKVGETMWQSLNNVFDLMPICAIIDESIFCAHGGIPSHATRVDELYKIPSPLQTPEEQSQIAWEILWNDPVTAQEFNSYYDMTKGQNASLQPPQGFLANTKRGTAYYFSDEALNRFFQVNRLSHVIRAHEVIPNGYQFHMGGRCITIFSSSRYCNGLNEAAVALVNDEKIRVIKIDTN